MVFEKFLNIFAKIFNFMHLGCINGGFMQKRPFLFLRKEKFLVLFFFATGCAFLHLKEKHQKKQTTLRVDRIVNRLQMIICSDVCSPPKTSPH
ncbi:MAG: hypothetical protein IKI51_05370, partial [Clostridia bacterium]|nr:hypothetical protein [Clostridia bacterium]